VRFSNLDDRSLARFRVQSVLIALVWAILALLQSIDSNESTLEILAVIALWVCVAVIVTISVLVDREVRRRKREAERP
jgi:uncharacterized membrane protein HdeD (DUF308 family)